MVDASQSLGKSSVVRLSSNGRGGSVLNLVPVLDDKGDLKTKGENTADLTESLGYLIVTVPSKGVKTVNGKAPKLEE